LDGLNAFKQRGIVTAELIFAGKVGDSKIPLIVLARLPEPKSIKDAWDAADYETREQILKDMIVLLARHHQVGVCQTDLHLDNFVISQGDIYSLDGAGVSLVDGEVDSEAALKNIALFLAQLPPEWEASVDRVYDLYCASRGVVQGPDSGYLLRQIKEAREWRWKKFQGKLFRDCTAFRYRKLPDRLEIVSRRHIGPELEALLKNPDESFPGKDKVIKDGITCTVWAVSVDGLPLVIKRYNTKGLWYAIRKKIGRGRAGISWINAYMLTFFGINTPLPVALLVQDSGIFQSQSYFITEAVVERAASEWLQYNTLSQMEVAEVDRASQWFLEDEVPMAEKRVMAGKIAELFQQLENQYISHGDMKAANILIVDKKAVLIDLDTMKRHKIVVMFRRFWKQDMRRFMSNWDGEPKMKAMFRDVFREKGLSVVDK